MAANNLPIVPIAGRIGVAVLSAATTGRTVAGITGLTLLASPGTNGTRIDTIKYMSNAPIGTANSANVLRIWYFNTALTNAVLIDEIAISIGTAPSATVAGVTGSNNYVFPLNQLIIPSTTASPGSALYCSIHTYAGTQDGYNVEAFGGDY